MNRKTRTGLLALALACAAGLTTPTPVIADAGDPTSVPPCLDIIAGGYTLQQGASGDWVLTLEQKLASPSCPGGATYSLHMHKGLTDSVLATYSNPEGLGGDLLRFTVPVVVEDVQCDEYTRIGGQQVLVTKVDRKAVKGFGTTARGAHGDRAPNTGTFLFHSNEDANVECPSGGAAGWS